MVSLLYCLCCKYIGAPFSNHKNFVLQHPDIKIRRIVTVTHISKYYWVKDLLDAYKDYPNYSMGYIDIGKNCLPFLGIMIFDRKEIFITAITEPEEEAIYIRSKNENLCKFFTHYVDKAWEQFCIKLKECEEIRYGALDTLYESLHKPNIIEHNLSKRPPSKIRVAVLQIDLTKILGEKKGLSYVKNKDVILRKLKTMMNFCQSENVNMIVLPELSAHDDFLKMFQTFSKDYNTIIIGGSFYTEDRKNVCPIFVGGKIYHTEKVILSPFEVSPVAGEGAIGGNDITLIRNSTCGTFCVVICSDYLEKSIVDEIYSRGIDILAVVSLNNNSERFLDDMSRDCELRHEGVYILYSNAVLKKDVGKFFDGKTSIFGFMDKRFLNKIKRESGVYPYQIQTIFKDVDGVIVADIDLKHKRGVMGPPPKARPNITNIKVHLFDGNDGVK